ncbi:hypothetical protein ASE14_10840 [Agromyces sp. Root81]|nr:hypothetical protein ASE14_10840 [Agromyces sp. Root81]
MGVEEAGQFRGDLGQQFARHGDESISCPPDTEAPSAHRPLVVGFGAVLIEEGRPGARLHGHLVGRAPNRRALPVTRRLLDEGMLCGVESCRVGDRAGAAELADDGVRDIEAQNPVCKRGCEVWMLRRHGLTGQAGAAPGRHPDGDAATRLGPRDLRDALDQLGRGPAPLARRQSLTVELDPTAFGDFTGEHGAVRVEQSPDALECAHREEQLIVTQATRCIEAERGIEHRADLLECVGDACHVHHIATTHRHSRGREI